MLVIPVSDIADPPDKLVLPLETFFALTVALDTMLAKLKSAVSTFGLTEQVGVGIVTSTLSALLVFVDFVAGIIAVVFGFGVSELPPPTHLLYAAELS
jgi:hypothetical protein